MTRPLHASAAEKARAWLLLEHPGPWPAYLEQMKLSRAVTDTVARAGEAGIRVQLIRRPRSRRATPPLQVYASWVTGEQAWLEGRALRDPGELAALDLDALAAGRPPCFGTPMTGPVVLVCTHGRLNADCARLGRPLATSLATSLDTSLDTEAVWETTHVGGDELAANLVCLPHGLYYGRLTPQAARAALRAYEQGEVLLPHYRGRAGLPTPLQAVEHHLRRATGLAGIADVTVDSAHTEGELTVAWARAGGDRYRLVVRWAEAAGSPCSGCQIGYRLLELSAQEELSTSKA